eukprot:4830803-Pleurochrysis_carterae.AAC.1
MIRASCADLHSLRVAFSSARASTAAFVCDGCGPCVIAARRALHSNLAKFARPPLGFSRESFARLPYFMLRLRYAPHPQVAGPLLQRSKTHAVAGSEATKGRTSLTCHLAKKVIHAYPHG